MTSLIQCTSHGLFCAPGNFYIDPWYPVTNALITHAHSDHARFGASKYLAHRLSVPVMKQRLGADCNVSGIEYEEVISIGDTKVSFHPAGHVPGSAQIKITHKGQRWVAMGDYKITADNVSTPFEPVQCEALITESTFALPVFTWRPQREVFGEIHSWWRENSERGITSILAVYALGKAQRVLGNIDFSIGPVFAHRSVHSLTEILVRSGISVPLPELLCEDTDRIKLKKSLLLVTGSLVGSSWLKRYGPYSLASASGWMSIRGIKKRRGLEKGFVLSDHADFPGLLSAVKESQASKVFATHGYTASFVKYLREIGYDAHEVKTEYAATEANEEVEETTD